MDPNLQPLHDLLTRALAEVERLTGPEAGTAAYDVEDLEDVADKIMFARDSLYA